MRFEKQCLNSLTAAKRCIDKAIRAYKECEGLSPEQMTFADSDSPAATSRKAVINALPHIGDALNAMHGTVQDVDEEAHAYGAH